MGLTKGEVAMRQLEQDTLQHGGEHRMKNEDLFLIAQLNKAPRHFHVRFLNRTWVQDNLIMWEHEVCACSRLLAAVGYQRKHV